jgi:hypothetical protein
VQVFFCVRYHCVKATVLSRYVCINLRRPFTEDVTSVSIEGGSLLVALIMSLLTGYSTMELNDNPMTASLSLSEFWGQRWNRMVAGLLKVSLSWRRNATLEFRLNFFLFTAYNWLNRELYTNLFGDIPPEPWLQLLHFWRAG